MQSVADPESCKAATLKLLLSPALQPVRVESLGVEGLGVEGLGVEGFGVEGLGV